MPMRRHDAFIASMLLILAIVLTLAHVSVHAN